MASHEVIKAVWYDTPNRRRYTKGDRVTVDDKQKAERLEKDGILLRLQSEEKVEAPKPAAKPKPTPKPAAKAGNRPSNNK